MRNHNHKCDKHFRGREWGLRRSNGEATRVSQGIFSKEVNTSATLLLICFPRVCYHHPFLVLLLSPWPLQLKFLSLWVPLLLSQTQVLKLSRSKISILFSLQSSLYGTPFHSDVKHHQQSTIPNSVFQSRTLFQALNPYVSCLHDTFICIPHGNLKCNIAHAEVKTFLSSIFSSFCHFCLLT